jgi:integrase
MVETGLRPKTIRDAKLAPVRAILQWAVDNRRLPLNPAERVTIDVRVKASETRRGFKDEEASLVLSAALRERDPVRRWVPWLCAYSGARLSEVCQLRVEDILQIDGIWCMKFDPDAGSLKTRSSERAVPLHPAVLEREFLEFVRGVGSGPLFANLTPDKFGSRGGNGTKILGRWVRSLGLTDDRISPSHSWRHRLKTMGRQHELAPDIVNAITGHGRRSVADSYGEFPIAALYRELKKIPPVNLAIHDIEPDG